MRISAVWLVLAVLLGGDDSAWAGLEGRRVQELPEGARRAFGDLLRAVETGDRPLALGLIEPESRISATPLLEGLLAGPTSPRAEVRLRLAGWQRTPLGLEARAILQARVRPREKEPPLGKGVAQRLGYRATPLRIRWAQGTGLLLVESGVPAVVVAARADWRLEAPGRELRVRSELELVPASPGTQLLALELPDQTRSVELASLSSAGVTAEWIRVDEDDGGLLVLDLAKAESEAFTLTLLHEGDVPDSARAGGDTLYFPHASAMIPWAGGRFHTWDVTLDIPAELDGVSIGKASELEAPEGRRRLRYSTDRLIDYPGLAVGRFRVDRRGPLELWRIAEVGGPADELLGELATLVEFHESRVAPLPYGAFRLVELDMGFAGAVSYASVIFMKTSIMAQDRLRFSILSHEVAHQWWGNAVQGDQHTRWISEGMANALMDLFVGHSEGEDEKQDLLDGHREKTLASLGPGALPLAHVRGRAEDVYDRGALFVHALHDFVGGETFWRILRAWASEHAGPEVGTAGLRATAERVAGRSLAEVFEPWLGSTALPVLEFDWAAEGNVASLVITQDEPAFALEVPVEAMLPGGESSWTRVAVTGTRTETAWELPAAPLALRLDPREVTPRVRGPERFAYFLGEGQACLARGETERGLALLERAEATGGALPESAVSWRARVLASEGELERSDEVLAAELAVLSRSGQAAVLLKRIDGLLSDGRADLSLALLDELAKDVEDGAALPLRRAHALRLLGREDEARKAWQVALEQRPDNAAARLALGLEAAGVEAEPATILDEGDDRLDGNAPAAVSLLVASQDRWGLLLPGSKRLLLGRGEDVEAVRDYAPAGLLAAAVVDADAEQPLVVTLEGGKRRSRLSVIALDAQGRGRLLARHDRTPGKPVDLLSDGRSVFLAWEGRQGGLDWYRFVADLRGPGSAGPDDRDGLVTLKVKNDDRFERHGHSPEASQVTMLADGTLAWLDTLGRLQSAGGALWEELEGPAWQVLDLRRAGDGAGLLLAGNLSKSPIGEDSLPERRLLVVDAERLLERRLPADALQAVLGPDGSVLVLRGREGCSVRELRVSRLPPGP